MNLEIKLCRHCGQEYNESENFNWSCRVHLCPFNREEDLWWCCGKKGKDQPGCKI